MGLELSNYGAPFAIPITQSLVPTLCLVEHRIKKYIVVCGLRSRLNVKAVCHVGKPEISEQIRHWGIYSVKKSIFKWHILHQLKFVTSSDDSGSKRDSHFLSRSVERRSLPLPEMGCSSSRAALMLWSSLLSQETADIRSVVEKASPK